MIQVAAEDQPKPDRPPAAEDALGSQYVVIGGPERKAERTNIIVMKFGGTSVADATCMKRVANRIVEARKEGHPVVAVVSARGDTTDELIEMAHEISENPPAREMDMLLSTGEIVSSTLLSMALHAIGYRAIALSGPQAGISPDSAFSRARITGVEPRRIIKE